MSESMWTAASLADELETLSDQLAEVRLILTELRDAAYNMPAIYGQGRYDALGEALALLREVGS